MELDIVPPEFTVPFVLRVAIFFGLAGAIGYYALRGVQNGKVLVGVRFYERQKLETWIDRSITPIIFWFVIMVLSIAALIFLVFGVALLWGGK
jgi:hypothetical protein